MESTDQETAGGETVGGEWTGGCLCGSVRYRASAEPQWAGYCHCGMCRKASGAPFMSFVQFPDASVDWTKGEPGRYQSSTDAVRRFCGNCGSSLTFETGGLLFIALGSLDSPERVTVESHCYCKNRLPGIKLSDGLPQFPGPVGGKGGLPVD